MNTWIVCVSPQEVEIFHSRDLEQGLETISHYGGHARQPSPQAREALLKRAAQELDQNCGSQKTGRMILLGEAPAVSQLCQRMSDDTRDHVIGIIPRDFCGSDPATIAHTCQSIISQRSWLVH